MTIANVMMDTAQPVGSKLDDEMIAEIEEIAPGIPPDGTITEAKLHAQAVSKEKIKPGAVDSTIIAEGGVKAINYESKSVGSAALADHSVGVLQAGTGVCTAYDAAGNPVESKRVYLTAAQYALIETPDPNTDYYIS
ncbi:hypothetical protein SEA_DONNY_40 [Mycobacterium phage Donny]|uniref:Uncharacterized protein n=3 Tax=Acadianvirus acadian TaxID=1982901 RepID=A0A7M1CMC2_9CAUD|nr:tail fiber protein [Mycobacterium phage Acadian]AER48954.1 hypothetical protein ACADIAN_40 [Mycobacterium phage Acadian]QBI96495.1 hypothetical protein SEA_DONNY_40 [Mycobacterium phage Donny]QOP65582.1 hypothetical protein SEA_SUIGENERIS_40 [Mycobacterium phage Suigeneris]WUT94810.1 hypothetical protein PRODRIGUEZ_40 [Mycobacterium phage PRodriguez]